MENRVEQLVSEINQIRSQYESEVGDLKRKVWPRAIRERLSELGERVGTVKRVSELTGLLFLLMTPECPSQITKPSARYAMQ